MDRSDTPASHASNYFYELDGDDRIIAASENWDDFALANAGGKVVFAKVRDTKIWDHIADSGTADMYAKVFAQARKGKPVKFFLRCDSPAVKRMLAVTVENIGEDGRLRISTLVFRADIREEIELRADDDDRPALKIPACSWCEKVRLPEIDWQEVEHATAWLDDHDLSTKCQMSYTICPNCRSSIDQQLQLAG